MLKTSMPIVRRDIKEQIVGNLTHQINESSFNQISVCINFECNGFSVNHNGIPKEIEVNRDIILIEVGKMEISIDFQKFRIDYDEYCEGYNLKNESCELNIVFGC